MEGEIGGESMRSTLTSLKKGENNMKRTGNKEFYRYRREANFAFLPQLPFTLLLKQGNGRVSQRSFPFFLPL